jgi:hypothetical protein
MSGFPRLILAGSILLYMPARKAPLPIPLLVRWRPSLTRVIAMGHFAEYIGSFDKRSLTALYTGLLFSGVLLGITFVQLYIYFKRYKADSSLWKAQVSTIYLL